MRRDLQLGLASVRIDVKVKALIACGPAEEAHALGRPPLLMQQTPGRQVAAADTYARHGLAGVIQAT